MRLAAIAVVMKLSQCREKVKQAFERATMMTGVHVNLRCSTVLSYSRATDAALPSRLSPEDASHHLLQEVVVLIVCTTLVGIQQGTTKNPLSSAVQRERKYSPGLDIHRCGVFL